MLRLEFERKLPGFHLRVAVAARGNVLVLFGPSGSGKSLTLQCIAGLMSPDTGSIAIRDRVVFDRRSGIDLAAGIRRVGYVFQHHALFPHLTVGGNVAYGLHRLSRAERAARVREGLRAVRLEGLENRRPQELSGGQQQRVALARALVTRPDVLLLDEPFASLDSLLREQLRVELLALLRETGVPAVLVTHDLDEAYALGHEIAVYDGGEVLQHGPRDAVYHRPASRRVAELVGMKNLFPGIVRRFAGDLMEIAGLGFIFWAPALALPLGARVECCIRPEDVTVRDEPPGRGAIRPGQAVVPCALVDQVSYGGQVALVFQPQGGVTSIATARLHVTLPAHAFREHTRKAPRQWFIELDARRIHAIAGAPVSGRVDGRSEPAVFDHETARTASPRVHRQRYSLTDDESPSC